MSCRREFNEKFYKTCMPLLTGFEKERKELHKAATFRLTTGIIISIVLFAVLVYFGIIELNLKTFLQIFLCILSIVLLLEDSSKKEFEKKIKFKIMSVFCKALGDFRWRPQKTVDYGLFVNTGIVSQKWFKPESDDIFTGRHNGVSIEIAEVKYYKMGSRGPETAFRGVCVILDMNKDFHGHTLVTSDTALHLSPIDGLSHTTLEDSRFEKIFDVFTNDEVEARYLLTPTFMERLTKIKKTFMAAQISCAFYMNKLFISINTRKDMFSLGAINKPVDDYRQFLQIYTEITSIIELIDQLKLDQKIGL